MTPEVAESPPHGVELFKITPVYAKIVAAVKNRENRKVNR